MSTLTIDRPVLWYGRVSQDGSGSGRSVEEQRERCLEVIEEEGWPLGWELFDNDISASRFAKKERPNWQEAEKLIRSGKVGALVVWSSSRASRDLDVSLDLVRMMAKHGTGYCYDGRLYDPRDADDVYRIVDDANKDAYYAARVSKDVQRAMRRNLRQGKPHGKVPYGYRRENGVQTIYEPEAMVIREAADRLLSGQSVRSLVEWLNAEHPKEGRAPWARIDIRKTLSRPVYVGKFERDGKSYPGNWEPILTEGQRDRILASFQAKAGQRKRAHLLSGLIVCTTCGDTLRVVLNGAPTSRTPPSYRCRLGHCSINKKAADDWVRDALLADLEPHYLATEALASSNEESIDQAIAELLARRERINRSVAKGMPAEDAADQLRYLREHIDTLEASRPRRRVVPTIVTDLIEADDIMVAWKKLTLDQQAALVRAYLSIRLEPWGASSGAAKADASRLDITWIGEKP